MLLSEYCLASFRPDANRSDWHPNVLFNPPHIVLSVGGQILKFAHFG